MKNIKLYYERLQLNQITNTSKLICTAIGSHADSSDTCAVGDGFTSGDCGPGEVAGGSGNCHPGVRAVHNGNDRGGCDIAGSTASNSPGGG